MTSFEVQQKLIGWHGNAAFVATLSFWGNFKLTQFLLFSSVEIVRHATWQRRIFHFSRSHAARRYFHSGLGFFSKILWDSLATSIPRIPLQEGSIHQGFFIHWWDLMTGMNEFGMLSRILWDSLATSIPRIHIALKLFWNCSETALNLLWNHHSLKTAPILL